MSDSRVLFLVLAAFVVGALVAYVAYRYYLNRRTSHIRSHFGPEYSRLAEKNGAVAAETELAQRERRAASFTIKPLSSEDRRRYGSRWQEVQKEFVDDPQGSLSKADDLLAQVMAARGYPVQDFEQRAADLSVDHPIVVQHYHAAHEAAVRHRKEQTTTEDLRQAMIHYRALFDELVHDGEVCHGAAHIAPGRTVDIDSGARSLH
jgi:hypothetical protein